MIQHQSPQFQLLSANNLLNRGNRNCTAMVQPKNNVGSNNTLHMSHISTLGADHTSQQSRNMAPEQSSGSAATMVAQYNSCHNNQSASISHSAKHYKSTNQKEQHKSQSSSSKTEMAQAAGLQAVRDGATTAQSRSGNNEAKGKGGRVTGTQVNRSETIYKNNSGKVGLIESVLAGPGHNHSQTSLKSHRSGSRHIGNHQYQNFVQKSQAHAASGPNSAISPVNRSAANAKEQPFFQQQQQSFSSQGHHHHQQQRDGDQQSRTGLIVQGRATGLSTGSSEKYLGKLQASSSSGAAVPHQIIVNGFHHKPSSAIMSSHVASQGHSGSGRASQANSTARPKSNSGSGSGPLKTAGHESTLSKSKNGGATVGQVQAVMGLVVQGGTQSMVVGTDSQQKSANHSRKKHTQSTTSKMSNYTTDQKGKTVRHHHDSSHGHHVTGNATPAPQSTGGHSSSHGSALNSMRNYSGSLQKAPMATTSIYKSQRGHQYSKISMRGSRPSGQDHVLHNAKTMKALGVSGTVASESTGLSRSGRSGEGDRTGGANNASGAVHSSFSASGIPRHPKLMHQKHSGAITNNHNASGRLVLPNQKSQGGGSLTQNQTPNHNLMHSNSHKNLSKQRQFYNSNLPQQMSHEPNHHNQQTGGLNSSSQLDNSICHIGGSGSTTYHEGHDHTASHQIPSGMALHSSSDHAASKRSRHQQLFNNNNQKIQRFDFRDYDSEEKLRIKPTGASGGITEPAHSSFDRAFDPNIELRVPRQQNEAGDKKDVGARKSVASASEEADVSRGQSSGLVSDLKQGLVKAGHTTQRRDIGQKDETQQASESANVNSQRLPSQSKSTGKVTHSERTTELTRGGTVTSPLGRTVQIDDGKMKHFQQMIQNVKFHSNEMRVVQERKAEPQSDAIIGVASSGLAAARAYDYAGTQSNQKQQQVKSLQIQIPLEGSDSTADGDKDQKDGSLRIPAESERKDKSEGRQTSHSLQCGEENLLPSTEKKDAHSKISAQRIPKSGGAVGLMKTSTHLISNIQANKNIFLGKMPCNSTRNNTRYSQQILDDEFQLLFQKDRSSGRRRQEKKDNETANADAGDGKEDQGQETPKILYKDRASVTSRIVPDKVSFDKRRSPEKTSARAKGKEPGSSRKKEPASSAKKRQALRSTLLTRGTSQGPPVTKNRDSRIAAEDLVPQTGSSAKGAPAHAKGASVTRINGSNGSQTTGLANQSSTLPQTTLSKCIGIRSGSESNVKTNTSNIWNTVAAATASGLGNMEKISYNFNDQRGLGLQPAHKIIIPNDDPTKTSSKRTGIVRAYAANTNQGLVRNYNEDRVSIITNLLPPKSRTDITPEKWPRCSYFGIYDGHGGSLCADFLRDNLHQYVIMESCFPANPKEAIVRGFEKAEKAFMDKIYNPQTKELKDKSGSCAIVVLIVQEICYVANVGDSRAVLSCEGGQKVYPLSLDHKPGEECETRRIRAAGGQIYYRTTKNEVVQYDENKVDKVQQMTLAGPLRVLPGRLSVARTFGDPEAKISELGGNPNVVIHTPEVKTFQIKKDHDFIVLGCDGIFDKMSNGDAVMCVWKAAHDNKYHQNVKGQAQDVHKLCGMGVEYILKNSLLRRSLDNVTVVVIGFSNLKHEVFGHQPAALQFKSDGDSGTDNQLKGPSQAGTSSSQQQQQQKKQNIVANSHRERDSKPSTKGQDKQESGKTLERNRSANLPRDSCARQCISMQYQQIASSNRKSQETTTKGSRKHSAAGQSSALGDKEGSDRSSKKRALTSSDGLKEIKQSPTASSGAEAAVSQSLQIKKEYQNLHGNVSTGQLHKAHISQTARPSHSGQGQKEGAKPPLSSQYALAKHVNLQNQFVSQSTTPTSSLGQRAASSQLIGGTQSNPQKHGLKAPRQSHPAQSIQ